MKLTKHFIKRQTTLLQIHFYWRRQVTVNKEHSINKEIIFKIKN